jgi:SAM-dependent methyltransferase
VRRLPNRTRTSSSIPRRLLREGKLHLLPVYALMRTSDLAREGMDNSGSFRFADHVYRNEPSGRLGVGRLLDALLLRMRGARSMRSRYLHARREIVAAVRRRVPERPATPFRALSVPCGIARELVEAAATLRREDPVLLARCTFIGLDLDPEPLELSHRLAGGDPHFHFARGDALDPGAYPHHGELDVIVSTGLGEFLDDDALARFYAVCHDALRRDGVFVTSGMRPDRVADYLMRELAELRAHYRGADALRLHLDAAGFAAMETRPDEVGLQTLVVARKRAERAA